MCTPNAFDVRKTENEDELTLEERANRHVRRLEAFYAHLASYVGVNALLVGINLFTSPDVFWAIWPILGWGVKVAGHAVAVFGVPGRADWRERTRTAFLRRHGARPASRSSGTRGRDTRESGRAPDDETERLRRRVEHLEAIVTSADWDLVLDQTPESETPQDQTESLAREVIPN
jgi:hypothetical protein